ncbi:hypothetical protein [Lacinutrix sp. Hel_I_90]|uniref:hypothetical protein n=1 Tax=Lacinutrix sp. Hel_I_90 TaxID=1249999 RepID=UPI0012E02FAF|nr:hypothetical protein [Lacinutrix sp. Hel_I_90]
MINIFSVNAMEYIDLEDDKPTKIGFYKVKVQRENKEVLITEASWGGAEFTLTEYVLEASDYVFAWGVG